jgi:hypothetical protein
MNSNTAMGGNNNSNSGTVTPIKRTHIRTYHSGAPATNPSFLYPDFTPTTPLPSSTPTPINNVSPLMTLISSLNSPSTSSPSNSGPQSHNTKTKSDNSNSAFSQSPQQQIGLQNVNYSSSTSFLDGPIDNRSRQPSTSMPSISGHQHQNAGMRSFSVHRYSHFFAHPILHLHITISTYTYTYMSISISTEISLM